MTDYPRKIELDKDCKASFVPPDKLKLNKGDTVSVTLGGSEYPWPSDAKITEISFFGATVSGEPDRSDPKGTWDRSTPSNQPIPNEVTVGALGTAGIKLTDVDEPAKDDRICYGARIYSETGVVCPNDPTETRHSWDPDPELVLKMKTGGELAAEA